MPREPFDDYLNRKSQYGEDVVKSQGSGPGSSRSKPLPLRKSKSRGSTVYNYFRQQLMPVVWGKMTSLSEPMVVFNANVKYLIEDRGLTMDDIFALIDEFATRVSSGRVDVSNKSAWRVFMTTWHKLGQSATSGLQRAMERSDDDEDPWKL